METRSRHLKHFKYAVNQLDGAALLPLPAQLQLRLLLSWPQPESSGSHLGAGRLRVPWGPRGIPRVLLSPDRSADTARTLGDVQLAHPQGQHHLQGGCGTLLVPHHLCRGNEGAG